MQHFRQSGTQARSIAIASLLFCVSLIANPGMAAADSAGSMIIDIHDGMPWVYLSDPAPYYMPGNFMPGIDTWDVGFRVDRIWFYHSGGYEDSGIPYQIWMFYRYHIEDHDELSLLGYWERSTTCNHCWEDVTLNHMVWGGSDETNTVGVFIRPLGGTGGGGYQPRLWRDQGPDHDQLAALIWNGWHDPASGAGLPGAAGDRDLFEVEYYYSDWGAGEILLGMQVSSDGIVAAAPSNFSVLKSLY